MLSSSLRITAATMAICVVAYTALVWAAGRALVPDAAQGSLLRAADGTVVGSRLIAQKFSSPRYFWPRPSAVDYDAAAAGASNDSPTSPALTKRAAALVARYGASAAKPLPAELAAASGSGLDPDITEHAALYQAQRVAAARGVPVARVAALVRQRAFVPGAPLAAERLVNVLELNRALDVLARGRPD